MRHGKVSDLPKDTHWLSKDPGLEMKRREKTPSSQLGLTRESVGGGRAEQPVPRHEVHVHSHTRSHPLFAPALAELGMQAVQRAG